MADLHQVPPNLEVWKVGDVFYLVRLVNDVAPPLPIFWRVKDAEEAQALGIGKPDRTLSQADFTAVGAINGGMARELANTTEDPVDQIISNYETEVAVKPWLADPEILSIWTMAALEGRAVSDAELQGTEWWRTHTQAERQWLTLNASDPATAATMIDDQRARIADLFMQAGVANASDRLVNLVADNLTKGTWTDIYATRQIRMLADPHLAGSLDPQLQAYRDGLDTTRLREDDVRSTVARWLGPQVTWGDDQVSRWASRLREDPDAGQMLEDTLRRQFQTQWNLMRDGKRVYGDDPNLTYEDIAAPWRNVWQQTWGRQADETDPLFARIVKTNDLVTAERLLREKGRERGVGRVVNQALSDLQAAFGGAVRRSDPAVL